MTVTADRLIDAYMRELRGELADLPRASRLEVLDEIEEHIAEACAEVAEGDEVAIRNVLERLGDPAEIAEEARERFGVVERRTAGWREIAALVLLPIGGVILPFFGWFIGLILLWASDAWTTRDKWLGTLVIPGGLATPLWLGTFALLGGSSEGCSGSVDPRTGAVINEVCTGGQSSVAQIGWIALFATLVISPIVVAVVLARRMGRATASSV